MPNPTAFCDALLGWYDTHARTLPWRGSEVSPYFTWVSEVMLQQTRVDTAQPYFERFTTRFPTVNDLAHANLDEVLQLWSGLGYYSRARNMHRAAQAVVQLGTFPNTVDGLRALPGVGPYMAGAIGSIAFGLPVPAVDGNLERVLARVEASPGGRKQMTTVAQHLLGGASTRAGDFNQALMDVGATVCTPRSPSCDDCPLQSLCAAHEQGTPTAFPVVQKRKKAPIRHAVAGVQRRLDGAVLLGCRPAEGLFGGLLELPGRLLEKAARPPKTTDALAESWSARLGVVPSRITPVEGRPVAHTLTHMRLRLHLYVVDGPVPKAPADFYSRLEWSHAPETLAVSTLTKKAIKRL